MSFYNKSTNFAVKDSLTTGDPNKIVSGVEIDTEFTNIASGFSSVNSNFSNVESSKSDKASNPTEDNIATLTSDGNIKDSGSAISDLYSTDDLKTDLNATGDAPVYAARAWVRYNRITEGVDAAKNISSVTKLSTGQIEVTFDTAMQDSNYAVNATPRGSDKSAAIVSLSDTAFTVYTWDISTNSIDDLSFSAVVFR